MGLGSDFVYERKKRNFLFSMLLSLVFLGTAVDAFLSEAFAWLILSAFVFFMSVVPSLVYRDTVAAPWELLFLVSLPFVHKSFGFSLFSGMAVSYASVAVTSLLVVVEMDEFTSLRTSSFFAVFLTAIVTVAMAGFWALVRWLSDIYLGTTLITSEEHLMWEFTAATAIGAVFGLLFHYYFKRRADDIREVKYSEDTQEIRS
ncbi:hypothetical protein GKQ38_02695 [Candidatus Nanohaloarchaea archaeon]|nr:hypothetical protein GKQ38_02695 [Candidatus Nanohaloarchaea archaeon]